jgi:single-strand DNA-binding protein
MANFNKVILVGNITRDPELSYTPSQTAVCEFGIAVNRKWGSGAEAKEEVLFMDCAAFGKTADLIAQYLKKGSGALVEGRLKMEQWEKDGVKKSKIKVIVEAVQFLGAPSGQQRAPAATTSSARPAYQRPAVRPAPAPAPAYDGEPSAPVGESDIPY